MMGILQGFFLVDGGHKDLLESKETTLRSHGLTRFQPAFCFKYPSIMHGNEGPNASIYSLQCSMLCAKAWQRARGSGHRQFYVDKIRLGRGAMRQ